MKTLTFTAEPQHEGKTIKYMALNVLQLSQSAFRSIKFNGAIWLNGKKAYAADQVGEGNVIQLTFPEEKSGSFELPGHDILFSIPYEDEAYLVIDKPSPLPTMYSPRQGGATLETGLYQRLGKPKDYLFRPINRLDKGTSGLMVVAKNAHAQQLLQKQLHTPSFIREYTALCEGVPERKEGIISAPIANAKESNKRHVHSDGKPAVTHYQVLQSENGYSMIRLRLETGRTHQIRVHMAHIGCPVTGDYLYGKPNTMFPGKFALHSTRVQFTNPLNRKIINVISNPPEMWYNFLRQNR